MVNSIMPINGRSKIRDITSLPAYYNIVLGVLGTLSDIMKQGGVRLSHGDLILPGSLIYLKVLPLHFQLDHSVISKPYLYLVQYMQRLRGKLPLRFDL